MTGTIAETAITETAMVGGDEKVQIVAKLSKSLVKRLDILAIHWEMYRAEALEKFLGTFITQAEEQLRLEEGTP